MRNFLGFLSFWLDAVFSRTPSLSVQAFKRYDLGVSALSLVVGTSVAAILALVPWWTPLVVLVVFGSMWAVYEKWKEANDRKTELEKKLEERQKRRAIKNLLAEAIKEGRRLRTQGKGEQAALRPAVSKWVEDTQELIERAFDKADALYFRGSEIDDGFWPVDECLRRLDHLRAQANHVNINPDFDSEQ